MTVPLQIERAKVYKTMFFWRSMGSSIIALLLAVGVVHAAIAPLEVGAEPSQEFTRYAEIFVDASGTLDAPAVAALTHEFRPVVETDLNRRYDDRVFWLRATLHNANVDKVERWLSVGHPRMESATLFQRTARGWHSVATGLQVPLNDKPVDAAGLAIPLTLEGGESSEILLRVQSRTALDLNAILWQPTVFLRSDDARQLMIVAGVGGSLIVAFISLSVFARLRQRTYLYFSLLHLSTALMELGREGLWERYLWPAALAFPIHVHVAVGMTAALSLIFIQRDFFDLRTTYPRWDRVFLLFVALSLAIGLISPFNYGLWNELWSRMLLVLAVLSLVVPAIAWLRGNKTAGYLALSYSVAWLVEGLRAVSNLGFVHLPFTHYTSLTWSLLLAAPMFFLALSEQSRALYLQLKQSRESDRAKSDFLARVSHELHAPLNTMIGYARMLRRGSPRLSLKEGTTDIERNGVRLLAMIDELLDQSRLGSGNLVLQLQPLALQAWIDELERSGAVAAEARGNVFVLQRQGDLPDAVMVDAPRLRQVLDNLVSNANRHTRAGHIALTCEASSPTSAKTARLTFSVMDNGEGISPGDRAHILEPFFQGTHQGVKPHKGIGLGLSIANDLVRLMGGTLNVASTAGKGSTFSFSLECALAPKGALPSAESFDPKVAHADEAGGGLSLNVLVAEDDPAAMGTMEDALDLLGCTTKCVTSGNQAIAELAKMREGTAHFDVVVTDQIMADGDGWDVLRYACEYCKGLPVILVSGINPQRPDGLSDAVKFDASLRKPFALQDLARALSGIRPAARAVRRPDADVLGNLLALVRLGEVSGIEEWSDQLEVQAPGYAAFATEVRQAVHQLDFDRLAVLAAPESPV